LRIFTGDITAFLLGKALTVLTDLLSDLTEMRLEVGNYILSLDFLGCNDSLVIFFECFVLILILTCQHFILVKNDLSTSLLLLVHIVYLINNQFFLELKIKVLFVSVLKLLKNLLKVELVHLLNLSFIV
jgi:hypothetical protein